MQENSNNLVSLQVQKDISCLFKSYLGLLEDIRFDSNQMVEKISKVCDKEFVDSVNYFTPEKYEQFRKKILDNGNSCARKILTFLDYYDFNINREKLDAAINQKRVVRKFTTSSPSSIE